MGEKKRSVRLDRVSFQSVASRGKRRGGAFLTLVTAPSPSGNAFSAVISKKVSAQAVGRNLLRRRLFALLREVAKEKKTPLSYIVYAKKGSAELPYSALRAELLSLIS